MKNESVNDTCVWHLRCSSHFGSVRLGCRYMYDINGSDAGPAETPKLAVDAMAQSCWGGVEHSVHIPAHRGAGQGEVALAVAASPPEKWLNRFVRCVALIERLGNALGTLAFTWATVVLLGGYVSDLIHTDFGFGTAIFFLEGIR